jgi:CheY-like chemotaxis protein
MNNNFATEPGTYSCATTTSVVQVRKMRILIVDDDEMTRFLHDKLLSTMGYQTEAAADGEEAWKMILTTAYDLILTDYNMPRLNGLELAARIHAANMRIPVILNSGDVRLFEIADDTLLPLQEIVPKGLDCRNVLQAVARVLPLANQKSGSENETQPNRDSRGRTSSINAFIPHLSGKIG